MAARPMQAPRRMAGREPLVWPNGTDGTRGVHLRNGRTVSRLHDLSERIVIGGTLLAADLAWLASQGCSTIIDLRTPAENAIGGLSSTEERRLASDLDIVYHHVPIARGMRANEAIAEVRAILRATPGRALLHCTDGARAGTLGLIHLGCDAGRSLGECYKQAARLPVQPPVEAWVSYILDDPRRGARQRRSKGPIS